jgi:hypothetical protein
MVCKYLFNIALAVMCVCTVGGKGKFEYVQQLDNMTKLLDSRFSNLGMILQMSKL